MTDNYAPHKTFKKHLDDFPQGHYVEDERYRNDSFGWGEALLVAGIIIAAIVVVAIALSVL